MTYYMPTDVRVRLIAWRDYAGTIRLFSFQGSIRSTSLMQSLDGDHVVVEQTTGDKQGKFFLLDMHMFQAIYSGCVTPRVVCEFSTEDSAVMALRIVT